jgi:hypothetical protein
LTLKDHFITKFQCIARTIDRVLILYYYNFNRTNSSQSDLCVFIFLMQRNWAQTI